MPIFWGDEEGDLNMTEVKMYIVPFYLMLCHADVWGS
jgi:hypothetical protein